MQRVGASLAKWFAAIKPYLVEEKPPQLETQDDLNPNSNLNLYPNPKSGSEDDDSKQDRHVSATERKNWKGPGEGEGEGEEGEEDDELESGGGVTGLRRRGREEKDSETEVLLGWNKLPHAPSLHEVHSSVRVPELTAPWYKQLFAFTGLGFVISVGYMDPGNWATDISAGSAYGYRLLVAILLANFAAIFLQSLALKLGVVGERDLAQACRDAYPRWVNFILWVLAEIAIAATDLAEIIGSATALYLLFGIPLWGGVLITTLDVLFILVFGLRNFRLLEVLIFILCATIAGCFVYEIIKVQPNWVDVAKGFIPNPSIVTDTKVLYNAIGILGATVMPHNIYLHSSIIQTRAYSRNISGKKMAIKYGTWDSSLALAMAFFVNAAILILAAAAFHFGPNANYNVAYISDAYKLISPALGSNAARILFGVALLASGQNSTITGTLAGQVVMEGFLHVSLKPWVRRILTRSIAIIPAAIVAAVSGNSGAGKLLVLSQVILSLQLTFAVVPLIHFTSSKSRMGMFVNGWFAHIMAVLLAVIIAGLNFFLIIQSIRDNEFGSTSAV